MSKLAAISEGTTLKETPPSSMVMFREVTSPRVRLESDLSLGGCKGQSLSATWGEALPYHAVTQNGETEAQSSSTRSQRLPSWTELSHCHSAAHLLPLLLALPEGQEGVDDFVLGMEGQQVRTSPVGRGLAAQGRHGGCKGGTPSLTIFSAAVLLMKRDPCPGLPMHFTFIPAAVGVEVLSRKPGITSVPQHPGEPRTGQWTHRYSHHGLLSP